MSENTTHTRSGSEALIRRAQHEISRHVRAVPNFPQPGIVFKDLTPVLVSADGLASITDALSSAARDADVVAGIDARGFLLGGAIAVRSGLGVLAVRKAGKLPPPVHSVNYELEYGSASLEIPSDAVDLHGQSVFVVDDVLATGGTLVATVDLLVRAGARVAAAGVVMEIPGLGGRERIRCAYPDVTVTALTTG